MPRPSNILICVPSNYVRTLKAAAPDVPDTQVPLSVAHENVRGGDYYDRKETEPS
jgi:hypothetical protein